MFRFQFILFSMFFVTFIHAEQSGIDRLMKGNLRYSLDFLEHPNRSYERRSAISSSQEPFAVILGCSDSRVAPEIIFDQGLGDLFVVRTAGNVIEDVGLASIEFALTQLRASVVLVLGHQNCGAVKAVLEGKTEDIQPIADLIEPSIRLEEKKKAPDLLAAAIKANAIHMKEQILKKASIQKLVQEKKVEVYAGYYHLNSGVVEILNSNL